MKALIYFWLLYVYFFALSYAQPQKTIRYERIDYYKVIAQKPSPKPYKSQLTYYYNNGLPYRYITRNAQGKMLVDYYYKYNRQQVCTSALYKEEEETKFSIEQFSYSADSLQKKTEWLDSTGKVYYTMIEYLNAIPSKGGKPYRSSFTGKKLHGYDSVFYSKEGFEKRIFFTNTKGKRLNDRSFDYLKINQFQDWTLRNQLRADTIQEVQKRTIYYQKDFFAYTPTFYPEIISQPNLDQNCVSISQSGEWLFFTQGKDWQKQLPYISQKKQGVYTTPQRLTLLDTIYNGAISPSGKQIIYCKRISKNTEIWLTQKVKGQWKTPVNLSKKSGIYGGYFSWFNEQEIYLYIPENEGNLALARLKSQQLSIVHKLQNLNTKATEFSPWVDPQKRLIIFTRYQEGNKAQQGFFVSYNLGTKKAPKWGKPSKIQNLKYGWGAYVYYFNKHPYFIYTDGVDVFCKSFKKLNLKY